MSAHCRGGRGRWTVFAVVLASAILTVPRAPVSAASLPLLQGLGGDNEALRGIVLKSPVRISADTLRYDDQANTATAEGNVEILFGNRAFRADRVFYNAKSGDIDLSGHVHYKSEGDEFSFERITLNVDSELGVLYNGDIRIASSDYRIASEKLEKTGPRSFYIERGSLTTCPCDPEPDWKFEVRRSTVSVDGYAVGKDVTFRVRGVPVFYLPWGAFPVKLTRQSGLLLPDVTRSPRKGMSVQIPFYWAISRWSDATVSVEAMTQRGIRPEVEYRFALTPDSLGTTALTYFWDKEAKDRRSRFYGENLFHYGEDWTVNGQWDITSDPAYYVDLVETGDLRVVRHVPSRLFAGRTGDSAYQTVGIDYAQDHLTGQAGTDNTIQRMPEIILVYPKTPLGTTGVGMGGTIQGDYFYRKEGDRKIAQARGDVAAIRPIPLYRSVILTPHAGATVVGSDVSGGDPGERGGSRTIPRGGVDLSAEFRRDYGAKDNVSFFHSVRPQAGVLFVPAVHHDNLALTDMWSRTGSQGVLLVSLEQRILRLTGGKDPSELAAMEIAWVRDVADRRADGSRYVDPLSPYIRSLREQIELTTGSTEAGPPRESDLYARFRVSPASRWQFSGEALIVPAGGQLETAAVSAEWKRDSETYAKSEYRISRALAEDVHFQGGHRPFRLLGVQGELNYSIKNKALTEGQFSLTVFPRSDCWSIGLQVHKSTKPDQTSFKLAFTLKGIGSFGK